MSIEHYNNILWLMIYFITDTHIAYVYDIMMFRTNKKRYKNR